MIESISGLWGIVFGESMVGIGGMFRIMGCLKFTTETQRHRDRKVEQKLGSSGFSVGVSFRMFFVIRNPLMLDFGYCYDSVC